MRSGDQEVISSFSNLTEPSTGFNKPEIVDKSVVLPAPLGPMRQTTSPAPTDKPTSLRAEIEP